MAPLGSWGAVMLYSKRTLTKIALALGAMLLLTPTLAQASVTPPTEPVCRAQAALLGAIGYMRDKGATRLEAMMVSVGYGAPADVSSALVEIAYVVGKSLPPHKLRSRFYALCNNRET